MEFSLYYRGPLKSNARPKDKHQVRQAFHKQLKILWSQSPLTDFSDLKKIDSERSLVKSVGSFNFIPRVTGRMKSIAELEITLLKPEEKGSIITNSGDIDNRLKTLLDALKIPETNALPTDTNPKADEDPFFCLLEDDNLITNLFVKTEQWLDDNVANNSEVVAIIHVKTQLTRIDISTIGFA
jgi:hypothetical protein